VATEVEDRLAGAVAGELGFRAIGVEDPQAGDELRVVAAGERSISRRFGIFRNQVSCRRA
jgi:hypothetical protein